MIDVGLEYLVPGRRELGDPIFETLAETAGLGATWAGVSNDLGVHLYFDFSCGCGECPNPGSVEEARRLAEGKLTELGLEWTFVEEFDLDED